jgi:hypothetical protein
MVICIPYGAVARATQVPSVTVPNLTRSESTSIESTRGSEPDETRIDEYRPNESRDLRTVTGLTDSHVTRKGIHIARSPSTLLAP